MIATLLLKLEQVINKIDRRKLSPFGHNLYGLFCSFRVGVAIMEFPGFKKHDRIPFDENTNIGIIGTYRDISLAIADNLDDDDMRIWGQHEVVVNLVLEGFKPDDFL